MGGMWGMDTGNLLVETECDRHTPPGPPLLAYGKLAEPRV